MQQLTIGLDCDYTVTNKIITLFGCSGDDIEYNNSSSEPNICVFKIPFMGNNQNRALIEQIVDTVASEIFAKKTPVGDITVMPRVPDHMQAHYDWFFPKESKVISYDWEIENLGILVRKYESANPAYTNLIWEIMYGDASITFAVVRRQHTLTRIHDWYDSITLFEHDISKHAPERGIGVVRTIDAADELSSLGVILKLSRV